MIHSQPRQVPTTRRAFRALLIVLLGLVMPAAAAAQIPPACEAQLDSETLVRNDFTFSFCELCDEGNVRIVVENPFTPSEDIDFSDLDVTQQLGSSGLTYVPSSTTLNGAPVADAGIVSVSGANGQNVAWDIPTAFNLDARAPANTESLVVEYRVARASGLGDEGLVSANRTIQPFVELTPSCAAGSTPLDRYSQTGNSGQLALNEPVPVVVKAGRNLDAGQDANQYSNPVYGHFGDNVIWRIEVQNVGDAQLQDFVLDDALAPDNFDMNWLCPTEASASSPSAPACTALSAVTTINGITVPPVDPGDSGFAYIVGVVQSSCIDSTNTTSNEAWGCTGEGAPGGITQTSTGITVADASADLETSVEVAGNLPDVDVFMTGVNGNPDDMGARGRVRIRIRNNTGGTIKGGANGIVLDNLLPEEYVVDTTASPVLRVTPAYGDSYAGIVDTLSWTNEDTVNPLGNRDQNFEITSSAARPGFPDQIHMIRHGDVVTVTFEVVLIEPDYYDRVADLDVIEELRGGNPADTDRNEPFTITNSVDVTFEELCNPGTVYNQTYVDNDTANPEDLDVDFSGTNINFILTSTGDPLPLTVTARNRGGHFADDYFVYVTFGDAMTVQTVDSNCSAVPNPPTDGVFVWQFPTPTALPSSASVYACNSGSIPRNSSQNFDFEVVKNTGASFDDDLTFRADVIGEIRLSDDSLLTFPAIQPRTDGITDRANNYSLDALRARVVGFDLLKTQVGICTENNPPPNPADDDQVQIGEECEFRVEAGNWFGFETPGFDEIAVQNIEVEDQLPNGQGFLRTDVSVPPSTPAIAGVSLKPPPTGPSPLAEGDFDWTFNPPASRILEKDHWFRSHVSTRILNDPVDTVAPPNEHAAQSSNILSSTFEAVFENPLTGEVEVYTLGPDTIGFPAEVHRRVDLTVTEPLLTVTKRVCNETIYGVGLACSNFVELADDGDAFDEYIFEVRIANESGLPGVLRAPAYDVTVTTTTDPSDLLFIAPLAGDGLDNDADALIDPPSDANEGTIGDNVTENGTPAVIIASHTHSDGLLQIDAGESVVLYYRVDPDDDVAPLQTMTNSTLAAYDSLAGPSGSQTSPVRTNGDVGGARQYTSVADTATIQIIPVETEPKRVIRTATTPLATPPADQTAVIGEELEFELRAQIPVAQLRQFTVRDVLPDGLSCAHAPTIDLDAPPYAAADFFPGGQFAPAQCDETEVRWEFGDQTVQMTPAGSSRFDFPVTFIARVDNIVDNEDGVDLRNGGNSTITTVSYRDENDTLVTISIDEAVVIVNEPDLDLTKTFSVTDVDAGDLPRVIVSVTNNGTSPAYNPRVLEDLVDTKFTYQGAIQDELGGSGAPSDDVATFGADRPLFTWPSGFAIAPGAEIRFSFAVSVDGDVEPLELLANTIQADWTSLPSQSTALNPSGLLGSNGSATGMRIGALPNSDPADTLNDYEDEASESLPVRALALTKTDLTPTLSPEIGSHKQFEIEIALPEGTTQDLVVSDNLATGAVSYFLSDTTAFDITYEFVGLTSIAGVAPSAAAFAATPSDGDSGVVTWSVGTVVTQSEDDLVVSAISPAIRIRYFARVNNDLVTDDGDTLQNSAQGTFAHGETGLPEIVSDDTAVIAAIEPLLTITKALQNVTSGKLPADDPAFGDTLEYVVTIPNVGNATAHDVNIVDTLPPEVSLIASFTPTATLDGAPPVPIAGFAAVPSGAPSGPLVWGRGNSDASLDIPVGRMLTLTYRVDVTTPVPAGGTISNEVYADWTSLDATSAFERTGAGCPTITPPNDYCVGPAIATGTLPAIAPPAALEKANTQTTAAIGEAFVYRLTIPAAPYGFDLNDVRILDDFGAAALDMQLLALTKVSTGGSWVPVNTGTPTNAVIQDVANGGIDIPAGEQIVLDLTVVLENTPTNAGVTSFTNTARWFYNFFDDDTDSELTGPAGTSEPMMIARPEPLTVDKTGPATMTVGVPGMFNLNVRNGGNGTAWQLTLLDRLPDVTAGGTCAVAPTVVAAQVFEDDGATPVSAPLVAGTDFSVTFRPAPDCELELAMLSTAAALAPTQRLLVDYETSLDVDTQDAAVLTNVAGATQWFSSDPNDAGAAFRQTYTEALTDGTVGTADHEDAHTVTVALPDLQFEKTVRNLTTGEDPALSAAPGDTLQYEITVENLSNVAIADFSLGDELDRLNTPPLFAAGTLTNVVAPAGADTSGSDPAGGTAGTGSLEVTGLGLANLGDDLTVTFDITLTGVIADGSIATNQAQLRVNGTAIQDSDDPAIGGATDPTVVPIESGPMFRVEKISTDLTDDPNVLLAGETLRYTIRVENIGTDQASDSVLRDAIPVNTSYVAGSTTLNGNPVADAPGDLSPLGAGIPINAPGDPTPGAMRADAINGNDVATIVFDVVVDPLVADGTVISNQAFASAVLGGIVDQPSDDPDTAVPDDPTLDVVGNAPLLFAPKSVVIGTDGGTLGVVDPNDVLHYTITVFNNGAVPATAATLIDAVPANTTWVADSLRLNGLPVGVPDGGTSPLAAGIGIQSSDLPAPLPGVVGGTLNPGENAVIEFDLMVNALTPTGTLISNQATVGSAELPNLLTDGDGNPATGPEPTVVVVGDGQQLAITKQVSVVGGGPALAGGQLEYVVRITNVATVPAQGIVITDDLDLPDPAQLSYVPGSATLDGLAAGVVFAGSVLTADYSTTYGPLAPSASAVLRFRADIAGGLAMGTPITNTGVVTWNTTQTAEASATIAVGGMPGIGRLNGRVWHDVDFDDNFAGGDLSLANWTVELLRNGAAVQSTTTAAAGTWTLAGVAPNDLNGDVYELRFSGPGATATSAALGVADSAFTNGLQQIRDLVVGPGANLQDLNLPIDPNGIVYDALGRTPVAGARVTLLDAGTGTALPSACFDDAAQQGQVTRSDGYYKFDLNFSQPACPSGGTYTIGLLAPTEYEDGASGIIPPQSDATTPPFDVPNCPGGANDAVAATAQHCEVQASPIAPNDTVVARDALTDYELHLQLDDTTPPGTSQLFNNHIPIDPVLLGNVAITKTTPSREVSRGDLVPYEITVRNMLAVPIPDLTLIDRYPAGFQYIEGSARVNGVPNEPLLNSATRELTWPDLGVAAAETQTVALLLAVGGGVGDGRFTNRAQALSSLTGNILSGEAAASVRVAPDPDFDCTDVIGKVFDDRDRDGSQTRGERGLAGVRLVTARGLVATTDPHGRFHITCAVVPNPDRGSNFVLKLDERSLPSGYRMSTRTTKVARATAGKALRFHFGASVHRIIGLDLADAAFEPDTTTLREQWTPRLELLIDELVKQTATLRISYVGDIEDAGLVERRISAVKGWVSERFAARDDATLTIETETYWRRGAPAGDLTASLLDSAWSSLTAPFQRTPLRETSSGDGTEQQFPPDVFTPWTQDPERLESDLSDRIEERPVTSQVAETVKRTGIIPPIQFDSGVAKIPATSVEALRSVLDEMRHLPNARLHLVGHADDRPLRPSLAAIYEDNEGLSRERAGEVAEYLQVALGLNPESLSFAYAGDSQPIASNATDAGRAKNRRVEVEVWHDEMRDALTVEEVVIPEDIKRVKVCRTETVCKLRYREGHERRARIRNLIAPLPIDERTSQVPPAFIAQVRQALDNLADRQNVTVKLIGHSDDAALEGRTARIYGTHLAVSKARAHRVARKLQDALGLPSSAITSTGRGRARPVASNDTERGRERNRRVEIEFWYDDPLQELPSEPQPCPDPATAELETKVYDPPWGRIEPVAIEHGEPQIPAGYAEVLQRALGDIKHRQNPRLRFLGYTRNERLDRRTASVYGDDIGLSAARARRTLEQVSESLALTPEQAEHEGRGYVHSHDVVNGGFLQGETDHVAVQVVYDEPGILDDIDGMDITRLTRELRPKDPLALNLMRITVDGEPLDDPGRSSADVQRCTDVALDRADVRFKFDDLAMTPRLSVTSNGGTIAAPNGASGGSLALPWKNAKPAPDSATARSDDRIATATVGPAGIDFQMYSNYGHFLERSEVRIFEPGASLQSDPLAILEIGAHGSAHWQPEADWFNAPVRELHFVLRAYDAKERFDETERQPLWLVRDAGAVPDAVGDSDAEASLPSAPHPLLAGYGESGALKRSIPLAGAGAVQVQGAGVPPGHSVWLAGSQIPVDKNGRFVAEAVLPAGMHTVEVAVLDPAGNGELFLRDLELENDDWFYVGIADVTVSMSETGSASDILAGSDATFDRDSNVDGRLAFFVKGRFGDDWGLIAHADTREGPVEDLFTDFVDKTPEALFRRIDSDYFQPTYGDDGTVEETAATSGKFFVKVSKRENHAMWGNFKASYLANELAQIDRGLYGANIHYQSLDTTTFGEQRLMVDGFAAQPGTVPSREEFRGTGGSLYYLRVQDLLEGSDRLRIEVRDKDSGLVTGVVHLEPGIDYDIDYLQGRVLLAEPLASNASDHQLVRSAGLSGDELMLVVQYEYTPGLEDLDSLATGGQAQYWVNDFLKFGATANRNDDDGGTDSSLYAADVTLRRTSSSWLKLQYGRSEGLLSTTQLSNDGGFTFFDTTAGATEPLTSAEANGYRADASIGFGDWIADVPGKLSLYGQQLDAGYTAPGQTALRDTTQFGGVLSVPLTQRLDLDAKADHRDEDGGLTTTIGEVDLAFDLGTGWLVSTGVRHDRRDDDSSLVPVTQDEGDRTDAVVQLDFDSGGRWSAYGFGQGTVAKTGSRNDNHRYGVGGAYRVTDRLAVDGEVSNGGEGPALKLGTSFQESEETHRYLSYALENERGIDGGHQRRGDFVSGARTRLSDSGSVYVEDRYQHADGQNGLSRAMGVTLSLTERFSVAANWELGTLIDRGTQAETERRAGGATLGYAFDKMQLSSGIEYRDDDTEQLDGTFEQRTTWLFKNNLKLQMTPDWRLLAKLNHSMSDSSRGEIFDGGYTEAVLGYAFRPVEHDRLNALAKYTWFSNLPTTDQVTSSGTSSQFVQRSHVASLDGSYDLTKNWSVGGKYAFRRGEVSLDREDPDFFANDAHLAILRTDYRLFEDWEALVEGRVLELTDLDERRSGALLSIHRHLGDHFKVGVGYNFTDFSDDLTDLDFDHHGVFFNFTGSL